MQSRWVRWIAYMLLAALVVVASCQAMAGMPGADEPPPAAPSASPSGALSGTPSGTPATVP